MFASCGRGNLEVDLALKARSLGPGGAGRTARRRGARPRDDLQPDPDHLHLRAGELPAGRVIYVWGLVNDLTILPFCRRILSNLRAGGEIMPLRAATAPQLNFAGRQVRH